MSDVLLYEGQAVQQGEGPVRCTWRLQTGRMCKGIVGWPAVGSVFVERIHLEAGEELGPAERELWAYLCRGECRTVAIFAPSPGG